RHLVPKQEIHERMFIPLQQNEYRYMVYDQWNRLIARPTLISAAGQKATRRPPSSPDRATSARPPWCSTLRASSTSGRSTSAARTQPRFFLNRGRVSGRTPNSARGVA